MSEKVFSIDEMELRKPDSTWTKDKVLLMEGIFYLKDLISVLELDSAAVKRKANQIERSGNSAWKVMGVRKIWNHWIVKMTVFRAYYQDNFISRIRRTEPHWDGNSLLTQKGLFFLSDVCKLIPFSSHQLRYQSKRAGNPHADIGVFKDEELKTYVVDMEIFSVWIKNQWQKGL